MMQLEFIPLKTPDAQTCGYARLSDGFAELRLREPMDGQAAVLTDNGIAEGVPGSRIAVHALCAGGACVQAVVVHQNGRVQCMGLARGASLKPEQVRARLMTTKRAAESPPLSGNSAPSFARGDAPRQNSPASTAAPPAASRVSGPQERGRGMPSSSSDIRPAGAPSSTDAAQPGFGQGGTQRQPPAFTPETILSRGAVSGAMPESQRHPPAFTPETILSRGAVSGAMPESQRRESGQSFEPAEDVTPAQRVEQEPSPRAPLPTIEQSAADSESFMALLRRADAAFSQITRRTPVMPGPIPPADTGSQRRSARYQAGTASSLSEVRTDTVRDYSSGRSPASSPGALFAPVTAQSPARPGAKQENAVPSSQQGRSHRLSDPSANWTEEVDRLLEDRSVSEQQREPIANPFPNIFPGARFQRVSRPGTQSRFGTSAFLEGTWQRSNEQMTIIAVPGAYSQRPPAGLSDFTRYVRARSGGYWIRITAVEPPLG